MKKIISVFLCIVMIVSSFAVDVFAVNNEEPIPTVLSFDLTTEFNTISSNVNNARASGLITAYGLSLEKNGTVLKIYGQTHASPEVVKCGFKNLTIQRRQTSNDSWSDYYEYGNIYADASMANLSTTLGVAKGYQYRISCKHYAKKNVLMVETISNTSGIVTVS